ncbi:MAG: hypothetical protein KGL39_31720 [Patescibacteria group bacterium]|nr:hypothetical protein [Patescibacteria group bacterium]
MADSVKKAGNRPGHATFAAVWSTPARRNGVEVGSLVKYVSLWRQIVPSGSRHSPDGLLQIRKSQRIMDEDFDYDDEYYDDDRERACHYCGGAGWGIVGCDWDSRDPINGPYNGEVEECPCCGGTGNAEDCTFW